MQTDTCLLNGQAFHLRRWGHPDLPPLLMLHGFPEYSGAWEDLAPLLADRFHCVAPDQRGYGQSYAPAGVEAYRISQLVSDMAALIDQLGGQVILMGHDWGASVAYALAARHPEKVSRLIVANGVHPVPFQRELAKGEAQSEASQYINGLRQEGIEEALEHNNYRQVIRTLHMDTDMSWMSHARRADYIEAWSQGGGRLGTMINWYRASPLQVADPGTPLTDLPDMPVDQLRITCPHLLIWGMKDTALLPCSTEGLEEFAPDLTRVEIAEADHWICHQVPDQVAAIIRDWV